jgi:hypothetical protein
VIAEPDEPFDEPWQARAFALGESLFESGSVDRENFRQQLMAAIADDSEAPYWESWLLALERCTTELF